LSTGGAGVGKHDTGNILTNRAARVGVGRGSTMTAGVGENSLTVESGCNNICGVGRKNIRGSARREKTRNSTKYYKRGYNTLIAVIIIKFLK